MTTTCFTSSSAPATDRANPRSFGARAVSCLALTALGCLGNDATGPEDLAMVGRVSAGQDFSCAVGLDQVARCWGRNFKGQLGEGTQAPHNVPRPVAGDMRFVNVGIHGLGEHACGVTTEGAAYCWGENDFGQLGNGDRTDSWVPVAVRGDLEFRSVTAGWRFSCGITTSGAAFCWGRGVWGQLGDGNAQQSSTPVAVAPGIDFVDLRAGTNNLACGITAAGELYCWGLHWTGALGLGDGAPDTCGNQQFTLPCAKTPARLEAPGGGAFIAISVGSAFACGVLSDGRAFCWGANSVGQLGAETGACNAGSTFACSSVPVEVSGSHRFRSVTAGLDHACAITLDGAGMCWGSGQFGKLGDGFVHPWTTEPIPVLGGLQFVQISAGTNHTCATATDARLYCWGANDVGQLGTGNDDIGLTPLLVAEGS